MNCPLQSLGDEAACPSSFNPYAGPPGTALLLVPFFRQQKTPASSRGSHPKPREGFERIARSHKQSPFPAALTKHRLQPSLPRLPHQRRPFVRTSLLHLALSNNLVSPVIDPVPLLPRVPDDAHDEEAALEDASDEVLRGASAGVEEVERRNARWRSRSS